MKVINNGEATEDMLQIYIHDEEYPGAVPNPALCGFARIRLEKGDPRSEKLTGNAVLAQNVEL